MTLTHLLFKPLNPIKYHLTLIQIPLLSHTLSHFSLTKIFHYSSSSSSSPSLSSQSNVEVVDKLIFIFTQQHPQKSLTQLTDFEPRITTDIVEAALKRFKNWESALKFFTWASNQYGYSHNCYTYNAMASILSSARQNAAMKELFDNLVNSRCYVSPGGLGYFVRCLGGLGMVKEANELFDHVKKMGCVPNDYSYNALLEAISKMGCVDLMAVRMNEMKENGWKPDKYTLTSVLQCHCTAGEFQKALEVFRHIDEVGWVDSYVFTILVTSLTKAGEVDKAIYLIDKMDDFKISLTEKTIYVLIHGFVKHGKVDFALNLLKRMQTLGFVSGISLYAVLIEGLFKNQEKTKALELFSQMKATGIRPDVSLLEVILSSLADEKEIVSLLREAKSHVSKKSMTRLFNSALLRMVKDGSIHQAYHLVREITKDMSDDDTYFVSLDASSYGIVIDGLCQKGELDLALELFNGMCCQPTLLLFNNLIDAFSNANKVETCHKLLNDMKTNQIAPSQFTHNSIFGYYCKIGDVDSAVSIMHEMRTHGHQPWIKHYTLLVKKLSTNRKVAEACHFLAMMVEEGFVPDIIAYAAAIDGWLKIEEVDYALKMFRDISASGRCPDVVAYNTIINGLCKAKRVSEARNIYEEMVQKSLIPSVVTYNLLIDAYCKNDDIDQALSFFTMMTEKNRRPNVVTFTTLIDGLCNAGRSDEALSIWNGMVCSPNNITYMALINGLCKNRKPDMALKYFEEMEEKNMRADTYVYVTLIDAFISVSNAPMALHILRKMIQNEKLPGSLDKNCVVLRDAVVKLLDDASTSSEMQTIIADNSLPMHLLQTGES
uniref:putative pentatricopeptide repeat-containing protein At5g08310, mitochondrial n=1 Tax=Erigeron canadensis TaxID=72917 RepID=UPI001CB8A2AE|nr:putative pentatricopeptide repeat-containing protein At5g08310, mitochondrial [Erigeron canadensis]